MIQAIPPTILSKKGNQPELPRWLRHSLIAGGVGLVAFVVLSALSIGSHYVCSTRQCLQQVTNNDGTLEFKGKWCFYRTNEDAYMYLLDVPSHKFNERKRKTDFDEFALFWYGIFNIASHPGSLFAFQGDRPGVLVPANLINNAEMERVFNSAFVRRCASNVRIRTRPQ